MNHLLYKAARRHTAADDITALYDRSKRFLGDVAEAKLEARIEELKALRASIEELVGSANTIEDAQAYAGQLVDAARTKVANAEEKASKAEMDAERAKQHAADMIENARADADNIVKQARAAVDATNLERSNLERDINDMKAMYEEERKQYAALVQSCKDAEAQLEAFQAQLADAKRKAAEALGL